MPQVSSISAEAAGQRPSSSAASCNNARRRSKASWPLIAMLDSATPGSTAGKLSLDAKQAHNQMAKGRFCAVKLEA